MSLTKVTFVINTFGRSEEVIGPSIDSILNQSQESQIYLIDQNHNPLNILPINGQLKVVRIDTTSLSKARNYALSLNEADWIIFLDDDAVLDDCYLENFNQLISQKPNLDIIAGTIFCLEDRQKLYSQRHSSEGAINFFHQTKKVMGGNFAIRSKTFKELSGFDENFGAGSQWFAGEDTDLSWKAFFNHKNMMLSHDLKVFHPSPAKISLEKACMYGAGKGALVKKWLKQGHYHAIYELFEMISVPLIKAILSRQPTFHFKSLLARLKGLRDYK